MGEEIVDGEEVGVLRGGDGGEGGAGGDEDGGVDEEGEEAEGEDQFGDGVVQAGVDGGEGGGVVRFCGAASGGGGGGEGGAVDGCEAGVDALVGGEEARFREAGADCCVSRSTLTSRQTEPNLLKQGFLGSWNEGGREEKSSRYSECTITVAPIIPALR